MTMIRHQSAFQGAFLLQSVVLAGVLNSIVALVVTSRIDTRGQHSARAATDTSKGSIIMCEYARANETLKHPQHGLHKEPDRVLAFSDWERKKHVPHDIGHFAGDVMDKFYAATVGAVTAIGLTEKQWFPPVPRKVNHQRERLESLRRIWGVVPQFFEEVVLGQNWWISSGSLIGTMRLGGTIPWDTDGDLAVDMNGTFNTKETFASLLKYAGGKGNASWSHSAECDKYGGGCLVVPLPKSVDPSGDVVFISHVLPTQFDWMGRFVDLKTGFFVEIINQGQFNDVVYPLQQCLHDGIVMNVPRFPAKYLEKTKQYSENDFNFGSAGEETIAVYLGEYTCQQCDTYKMSSSLLEDNSTHLRDNFRLSLIKTDDVSGKEAWISVDTSLVTSTDSCTRLTGSAKIPKLDLKTICLKP